MTEAITDYLRGVPVKVICARYGIRHKRLYNWLRNQPRRYPKMSEAKKRK